MRIAPGSSFRHLEIGPEIGRGAFATVYLATDTLMERTVALKMHRMVPSISSEMERKLALREARLVGRLSSPHVVTLYQVHDLGEAGWLMEMEYVDGQSLEQLLAERERLTVGETLRILRGVLTGLHVAHEHNIVHRDVKPGNVLLGSGDGAIKLTDFGLSCTVGDLTLSVSSIDGFLGTPQYVAPEVIDGKRPTRASDIWSTGVLAYRMLCGRLPFPAQTLPDLFEEIRVGEPSCMMKEQVPDGLKMLVRDCLQKDPASRPLSPSRLLARLEDVARAF
ncbi:MAG: serine/threonine-protein kinase [Planctomycetota bacterium]|nr:serine/threonine-protein kinase [Planctomycetota bacterium]